MPSYNLVKNQNLGDIRDTVEGRNNLELGTFATQDLHDVAFVASTIKLDTMTLKQPSREGDLLSINGEGSLYWTFSMANAWYLQNEVYLSMFANDAEFVSSTDLLFKGSFHELSDFPDLTNIFLSEEKFLDPLSNLRDVYSVDQARQNLRLKVVSTFDDHHLELRDITVDGELRFSSLDLNDVDAHFFSKSHHMQGWSNPFVDNRLTDDIRDITNTDTPPPRQGVSTAILTEIYHSFKDEINLTFFPIEEAIQEVQSQIMDGDFLSSNMDSFKSENSYLDIDNVLHDLNVGDIAIQDATDVVVGNLILESLSFSNVQGGGLVYYEGPIIDDEDAVGSNTISAVNFEFATADELGVVYVLNSHVDTDEIQNDTHVVYNSTAVSHKLTSVEDEIREFRRNISLVANNEREDILSEAGNRFVQNGLENLTPTQIRAFIDALELNQDIITSGTLKNVPTKLQHVRHDTHMVHAIAIDNAEEARAHIGCSGMSTQNVFDVHIQNGDATLSTLEVDDVFSVRVDGNHSIDSLANGEVFFTSTNLGESKLRNAQDLIFKASQYRAGFVHILTNGVSMNSLLDNFGEDNWWIDFPHHAVSTELARIVLESMSAQVAILENSIQSMLNSSSNV